VFFEVGGGFVGVELEAQRGEVHALVVEAILARGLAAGGGGRFSRSALRAARRPSAERNRPTEASYGPTKVGPYLIGSRERVPFRILDFEGVVDTDTIVQLFRD